MTSTTLLSRKQIETQFAAPYDGAPELTTEIRDRIRAVQIAGARHGKAGYYPDGDFSSDADWCYGVGAEITALETALECDGGEIMDLYVAAHGAFFRDGTINPGERDWCPEIYDMWFGAYGDHKVSVHARSFEDAAEQAAQYAHERWPGLFTSEEEMAELLREACEERGFTPEDIDWTDLRGEHAAAVEAAETDMTEFDGGIWIPSWEWGGDGPGD